MVFSSIWIPGAGPILMKSATADVSLGTGGVITLCVLSAITVAATVSSILDALEDFHQPTCQRGA
jgi:hypothetical protein